VAFVGQQPSANPDPSAPDHRDDGPDLSLAAGALPVGTQSFVARSSRRTRILIAGGASLALGAACLYTFAVDPNVPSNAYPQCPLKLFTGIDCPGCGGLRATNALLHGDIVGAADHNVLALILLPLMAVMFVRWVLVQFGMDIPRLTWPRIFAWATPIVVIAFTVARNIPVPGLDWLSSGLS
jgi:hypothetical protein